MAELEKPSILNAGVRAGLNMVPGVGQMARAARDEVGDDERLVRRLTEDERLRDMLVEASEAALRTSWEAKRITMGRVLAKAMADDADIDSYAAFLSALASLEAVHFGILARPLSGPVPEPYRTQLIAQGVVTTMTPQRGGVQIGGVSEFGTRLLTWIRTTEPGDEQEAASPT
jgi:hypothetical protein